MPAKQAKLANKLILFQLTIKAALYGSYKAIKSSLKMICRINI